MSESQSRVIKLGGSLLDLDELSHLLTKWLSQQPPATNVMIVGGGAAVERLRRRCEVGDINEVSAHWTAIRAMSTNARDLAERLDGAQLLEDLESIDSLEQGVPAVLDSWRFLREREPDLPGAPLAMGWDTTSDSISARVAECVGAVELVLLKSALPDADITFSLAAECGYVDRSFPLAAAWTRQVRCVNLRDDLMSETWLHQQVAPPNGA